MDFSANRLPGQVPATFGSLLNLSCPIFNFLRELSPVTSSVVLLITVALPGFIYFKKNKTKPTNSSTVDPLANDVDLDAAYAEELQLREALVASLSSSSSSKYASATLQFEKEVDDQRKSFCEICLDHKENWEMFQNDGCSHSFCYECTGNHITARIAQKAKVVGCPGVSCNATLDVNVCRFLISEEALIKWDESLCQSMILDSQKLYCPFRDCSAMLVKDSGTSIQNIKCPLCKRSFCAACQVPWHSEFTCTEFQKLNTKKGSKAEAWIKTLAKKKNWQRCPSCKIFVEKTEGCIHMTCRCGYEFCYRCGTKWTSTHRCPRK